MKIARRLVTVVPTLIGVVIVTFLLTRVLPGDPAVYFAGPAATPQSIAEIRKTLGLDRPLPEQFLRYIGDLAQGNLGNSLATGQPVVTEIATRLPASAELTLFGLIISMGIAIPLGILAAVKQGSWIDHTCRVVATAGVSLPVFFTGLLLVYVFYFQLGWSPAPLGRLDVFYTAPPHVTGFYLIDSLLAGEFETFRAALSQLILPGATLAIFSIAPIARMTRASMLSVLASEFVRTARASGERRSRAHPPCALRHQREPRHRLRLRLVRADRSRRRSGALDRALRSARQRHHGDAAAAVNQALVRHRPARPRHLQPRRGRDPA
jgi:peptide/nickel transport system permease protein